MVAHSRQTELPNCFMVHSPGFVFLPYKRKQVHYIRVGNIHKQKKLRNIFYSINPLLPFHLDPLQQVTIFQNQNAITLHFKAYHNLFMPSSKGIFMFLTPYCLACKYLWIFTIINSLEEGKVSMNSSLNAKIRTDVFQESHIVTTHHFLIHLHISLLNR